MEHIGKTAEAIVKAPHGNENVSLTRRSGKLVSGEDGLALMRLMAQTRALYPNQAISDLTAEMYMTRWEEMAAKYGMETFLAGLSKATRGVRFIPEPADILDWCDEIAESKRRREATLKVFAEDAAAKARWERERDEQPEPIGELPKMNDLRGISPNSTEGMSSEEFVRSIRDANW